MTVADAIRHAAGRLDMTSDTARLDAEVLMAHVLRVTRSQMLLNRMRDDARPFLAEFDELVVRRAAHEPVAYLVGSQEFYGLDFTVSPAVLIPRGDSETLVEAALEFAPDAGRILDMGTGSGALLLAFLAQADGASGIGIDASAPALAIAAANARALGFAKRAAFLQADWTQAGWCDELGTFDLVLCNPPYVETDAPLDESVCRHEPADALFAGPDGLDDYRSIIPQLPKVLAKGGIAVLEIGHEQADAVSTIAQDAGFRAVLRRDLAGRPRALILSTV